MKKAEQGKMKCERVPVTFVGHDKENVILTRLTCCDSAQLWCVTLVKEPITGRSDSVHGQY